MTLLCIASYEKGFDFLREAKRQGARVLLLTSLSLRGKVNWPQEAIDDIFYMPDDGGQWNREHTLHAVAHLMRENKIDRIVPLDDFDLELAAFLREHFRLPGLSESSTRFFRDKLAMRVQASAAGLDVPDFVGVLNFAEVDAFTKRIPAPWVLKPRMMAGAIGIKKIESAEQLWPLIHGMGDQASYFLLERYAPGEVFHVDSVVYQGEVVFAIASGYGTPPMDTSHTGGIFTTRILEYGSETERRLIEMNSRVLKAMGLAHGVSHTEFILGRDGRLYFLETSARVGGANIANLVEAASGLNPWVEWARLEAAPDTYALPALHRSYAGLIVCLARQDWPDTSGFDDPEVCWRMNKKNHVGLIVRSDDRAKVAGLLDSYTARIKEHFLAVLPPKERPTQ
ncbi:MAG: ATP-grasp domain-containing protein [Acidobacteria bacterium]|nr:ATP-grasp domain-containing protein [Acidobacteriota bacterium]